mmetsp:Transcript_17717/g.24996  ORF Transcript_17717/g.24996 Transcript_17717/m.24996 type:complete len:394 (-) Transcript_17717:124-1305(-)
MLKLQPILNITSLIVLFHGNIFNCSSHAFIVSTCGKNRSTVVSHKTVISQKVRMHNLERIYFASDWRGFSKHETSDRMQLFNAVTLSGDANTDGNKKEHGNLPYAERPFNPGPGITFGSSGLKLNIFGMFYGFIAIFLGAFYWWTTTGLMQIFYLLTRNKIDSKRRIPVFIAQLWGKIVMSTTWCNPKVEGRENLQEIVKFNRWKRGKDRKSVMFVANHNSWMDIPYTSKVIGWTNYKIVAKQELLKVPILSRCLTASKHVILDRTNRRSQMETFKKGVSWLQEGVHLVTFPEGTRSRTGRLGPFKKGAFKMAQKVGAPIVPISINYAQKVQPLEYIFPVRPSRCLPVTIYIGKPIETDGKNDDELMAEVWHAISENLVDSQKPSDDADVSTA